MRVSSRTSANVWRMRQDVSRQRPRVGLRRLTLLQKQFLDEISWMGRYDSAFAGFLKTAWDTSLSKKTKLILVVAGSVSAWIQQNIQKSKGYVGRLSLDLTLNELPIADCLGFWGGAASRGRCCARYWIRFP